MITYETIKKIHAIFMHLQIGNSSTQRYDPLEEYRKHIVIAKGLNNAMAATEIYCNTEKFTAWHKKIWTKRQQEIPHTAFCEWIEEGKVWRAGFRS